MRPFLNKRYDDCAEVAEMASSLTSPGTRSSELRQIRAQLAAAQDAQIHRVIEIVDNLAKRGDADAVIAPLRARLAKLKPRRKLSFSRLLFTPFNPLIVGPSDWSRESPGIPRTALATLARHIHARFIAETDGSNPN